MSMCQRKGLGCGTYLRNYEQSLFSQAERKGNTDGGCSYATMFQLFWTMK